MKTARSHQAPSNHTVTARRLVVAIALVGCFAGPLHATPEKAASYYEDALRRFEKEDTAGAVIQLKNAIQQDQKMLAAHLLLGKALLKNGDLKGAEAAFEEALKQGVNRGEVALPLGQVYLALGRPEAVIDRIQATGLSPALQVEVLTMRGNAYMEAGNTSQARQSWEQARAIDPRSASPLIAEVPMLLADNRLDQAREKAERAIELAPNNASAWNMKASVHHAALDPKNAMVAYDKALSLAPKHVDARVARAALLIDLKRDADARKDLDFLKTFADDEPRAAYLRAVLAGQKGDAKETNETLKEVTRTIDSLPPAWLTRREQLLMAGALAHYSLGNHQKSREYLDILIARSPNNMGAKKLLASIYVDAKDYGRAQPLLESLQRAMPEDPQVMYLLGNVNLAQKRYAQASSLLEQAAARSGSPEMSRSLAFSQLGSGQAEKGLASFEKAYAANPDDTLSGIALATIYMRQGKADKAMKVAEGMVKRDPGNLTALNLLGTLKGATKDKTGARTIYMQVLAKDPNFAPSIINLARLDSSEKRFDEARRRLDGLLKRNSNDHQILYEYGKLERQAGKTTEAIRYFTKAADVQRSDPSPGSSLLQLYLDQGQSDSALAVAKDLAGKYPNNVRVQIALARTYLASGDAVNARTILGTATRLAEYDPTTQTLIARLQLAAGNPEGAAYNVYKALQGAPDNLRALELAVEVEAMKSDLPKAEAALRTLNARHPNSVEASRATGNLAMMKNQFPQAIAAYRKALSLQESTPNAMALVNAYISAGEMDRSIAFQEEWLKKYPSERLMRRVLAETRFQRGQLPAARLLYQALLKDSPDDHQSLNNYANLLHLLNDSSAREMAERALKLSPNNPAYADTLGWILIERGETESGLRYLRESRLRDPNNAENRKHLAIALTKAGRNLEAKDELSAALQLKPTLQNDPELKRLRSQLGN